MPIKNKLKVFLKLFGGIKKILLYLYQTKTNNNHKILEIMTTTIAKFTTSKGNQIEIYTTSIIGKDGCVVFDKSCLLERVYFIGQDAYLNWDQLENGYQKVESIQSVVDAWKNEEIHF